MSGGRAVSILTGAAWLFGVACGAKTDLLGDEQTPERDAGSRCTPGDAEGCRPSRCSDRSFTSNPHPLSVYLMIDTSLSMRGARWTSAKSAIERFVADPAIAGMQVGLGLFPVNGETLCPLDLYARPVVPFGPLSARPIESDPQEAALVGALRPILPSGGTPTFGALLGALSVARARANVAPPDEQVIVVFVTDGTPTSCDRIVDFEVAEPARIEFRKNPPIRTFAIGLEDADDRYIDAIAQAGGGKAFYAREGDVASKLLGALEDIKGFLPCSFETDDASADPNTPITLELVGPSGTFELKRVPDLESCSAAAAFYVDVTPDRTQISLCPDSCTRANSAGINQLRVRVGCD